VTAWHCGAQQIVGRGVTAPSWKSGGSRTHESTHRARRALRTQLEGYGYMCHDLLGGTRGLSRPAVPPVDRAASWALQYPARRRWYRSFGQDSAQSRPIRAVAFKHDVTTGSPRPISARFCDPGIDEIIDRATQMQLNDPAAAGALWAGIDRKIVDQAPYLWQRQAARARLPWEPWERCGSLRSVLEARGGWSRSWRSAR
jgi:hypothetical protein